MVHRWLEGAFHRGTEAPTWTAQGEQVFDVVIF